jgi:hypothetical protein
MTKEKNFKQITNEILDANIEFGKKRNELLRHVVAEEIKPLVAELEGVEKEEKEVVFSDLISEIRLGWKKVFGQTYPLAGSLRKLGAHWNGNEWEFSNGKEFDTLCYLSDFVLCKYLTMKNIAY